MQTRYSVMPGGVHRSKRPSGCQQRKAKEARKKLLKKLAGSILPYVTIPNNACEGTSKDTARQSPTYKVGSFSDATMHSVEEQGVAMKIIKEEQEEVAIATIKEEEQEFEAEECVDNDCSRDGRSDIREKGLQIFCDVSFWEIPVPHNFRVEIIKRGSAAFQNKDGPFRITARKGGKVKGRLRKLSKGWFYKILPNGEKILRSWMVYSLVSESLYCFCCRLFATSTTETTSKFVTGFQKWHQLNPRVRNHEMSPEHLRCHEKWNTLAAGLRLRKTIDTLLVKTHCV